MTPSLWVVIPSAGKGKRFGSVIPKQYLSIHNKTILELTIDRFLQRADVKGIVLVVDEDDFASKNIQLDPRVQQVAGGVERADSVMNALHYLKDIALADDRVAVHDAARPCIRQSSLDKLFEAAKHESSVILAIPAVDTIKWVDADLVEKTLARDNIFQAQTPQVFCYAELYLAMQQAMQEGWLLTDECSALEKVGVKPTVIIGRKDNIKITTQDDLELAEFYLSKIHREKD